jgi:hypothetical protein
MIEEGNANHPAAALCAGFASARFSFLAKNVDRPANRCCTRYNTRYVPIGMSGMYKNVNHVRDTTD